MYYGNGSPSLIVSREETLEIIEKGIQEEHYKGKRVLVLTPDTTRTCPLPMMICSLNKIIGNLVSKLDFMVALGTHTPLSEERILKLYGISSQQRTETFSNSDFFNHRWDLPDTLAEIDRISKDEVEVISGGLLKEDVPVVINRKINEYDLLIILGPVFPHEVVGFSGGAKYLFPGISGGEFLHFFHWLGAVITCKKVIGEKYTPVRDVIDRAMQAVKVPTQFLAMVVNSDKTLCGLYAGDTDESWSEAADLSAKIHIERRDKQYHTVLGCSPEMYDEIWTAGKVMYKLEEMVTPNGNLIIYAPHIKEVSRTWGTDIEKIGYHVRDYFLAQMDRFKDIPRGVLAHSTHVKGTGSFKNGIEQPDVNVILATSIPEEICKKINLGYMNPNDIRLEDYQNKEDEGILFVDHAGEILYKLEYN